MRTFLLAVIGGSLIAGCSGPGQSTRNEGRDDEELRRYEREFQPSDFDQEPRDSIVAHTAPDGTRSADTTEAEPEVSADVVSGYRVQVFSTTNIDTAKARLGTFAALFPEEWFYLDFDPPTYKIRAGNFLTRYEADRFARMLEEHGVGGAWSVPQRVLKNPPPPRR
jgi:hypothetical protein